MSKHKLNEKQFDVSGMTCSACSAAVERTVEKLPGVKDASVNLLTNSMLVDFDESTLSPMEIIQAVEKIGYGASIKGEEGLGQPDHKPMDDDYQQMLGRLWVSLVFMVPLMVLTMGPMVGIPRPSFMEGVENAMIFGLVQLFMTLPVLYVNRKFFISGFKSLWHRVPNMDSLIAIGSSAAVIYGAYALFKIAYGLGHGDQAMVHQFLHDLYFESAAMILTLITLGKTLEARSKRKTSAAIEKLMDLRPETALVRRGGTEVEIPISDVRLGDLVIVKPGSRIPVDGTVVEGYSFIDESALTGESMPVEKKEGDYVQTATMNQQGLLVLQAEKLGEDTTLAQIIRLVEEANATKAPIAQMADKISGVFVPIVIAIALVTSLVWLIASKDFEFALSMGISVLVISCPCALGLATPVAIMVGTGKGARHGILFKSAEALEGLHQVDTIVLDKTGTLTMGQPQVTDILTLPNEKEEAILRDVASLEKGSEHPLGLAIVKRGKELGLGLSAVEHFHAKTGRGVSGDIEGAHYLVGNKAYMAEENIDTRLWDKAATSFAQEGKTSLYVAKDGIQVALIAVADVLKETSVAAVKKLRDLGKEVWMVTGDNQTTAEAIGKHLHLTQVKAEVMPQDKEQVVRDIQGQGRKVAMVGDGINDAPALARADIGLAIGQGTDVAIESADVVLMKDDLMDIVTAISLSKATIKTIKQNLFWALFYNTLAIPVAAGLFYPMWGLKLNPMIGAAAMGLSSLFVVTNALRLRSFHIEPGPRENQAGEGPSRPTPSTPKEKERKPMEKIVNIEGMTCKHCQARVENAFKAIPGVEAQVDLEAGNATITSEKELSDAEIKKIVEDAGYEVK